MFWYQNYRWKNKVPIGQKKLSAVDANKYDRSYKIIHDPYKKHFSIECYSLGIFSHIIYDSNLLDFRLLCYKKQTTWEKECLDKNSGVQQAYIRNHDDRLLCIEKYYFEGNLCRHCHIFSPHDILLCKQKMFYKSLNDTWNGMVLIDNNKQTVLYQVFKDEIFNSSSLVKEETLNPHLSPSNDEIIFNHG